MRNLIEEKSSFHVLNEKKNREENFKAKSPINGWAKVSGQKTSFYNVKLTWVAAYNFLQKCHTWTKTFLFFNKNALKIFFRSHAFGFQCDMNKLVNFHKLWSFRLVNNADNDNFANIVVRQIINKSISWNWPYCQDIFK
jgi:hypothetical protein